MFVVNQQSRQRRSSDIGGSLSNHGLGGAVPEQAGIVTQVGGAEWHSGFEQRSRDPSRRVVEVGSSPVVDDLAQARRAGEGGRL